MLVLPRPTLDVPVSLPRHAVVEQGAAPMLSALAFFFVMTSYYIMRPVREQLGGAVGSQSLPLFYGAVFAVMLLLTPVFGMLVARFPRKPLLGWSYSFFILCLLAFVPAFVAQDRIGARQLGVVFYVWGSVFNLFVVSLFWSFMADIFSSGQARRMFSLIALGGMAGAIFGSLVTKLLVQLIGVPSLLVVSAVALGLALILLLRISAQHDRQPDSHGDEVIGGSLWAGIKELWSRPFLRYMALLMVFGDGIGTLAYALMADYTKAHLVGNVARTAFYNDLDLATNLLGAVLQLTLTPWLLIRRGPGWGLVVPSLVNSAAAGCGVAWCRQGPAVWLRRADARDNAGDHSRLCLRDDQAGGGCAVYPRAAGDALQGQELRRDGGVAFWRCTGDHRRERIALAWHGHRRPGAAGQRRRCTGHCSCEARRLVTGPGARRACANRRQRCLGTPEMAA